MALVRPLLLLALLAGTCGALSISEGSGKNPIRRVVDMLQEMQGKVEAEAKAEKALFDRFMCYCKTGTADLSASVSGAESKAPQVEAALNSAKALKSQLEQELKQHQQDRADAKATVEQAKALREKEAAEYAKESSDMKTNLAAMAKAIAALEKGALGGFLQTAAGATLRRLSISLDMSSTDRDVLTSLLSQRQTDGYVPVSAPATGILKQLQGTAEKSLAETVATEQQRVESFQALVAAKEKEIEANTQAIEAKAQRIGQLGVDIVTMEADLTDTQKALLQDKQFLADLTTSCGTKQQEWDARSKTRADELVALSDTIKILNSDEALDLFKEAIPSPALVQVQVGSKALKQQALQALVGAKSDYRMDLIALALKSHGANFDKVQKMIDDMVKVLGQEQASDDSKKAYCEAEVDKAEDKKKLLDQAASDLGTSIEEAKGTIAGLADEIKALEKGIAELDSQVAKATENRKAEHEEFQKAAAADRAAKDLLLLAKNRLAKVYAPKLYKEPPKAELSAEERIVANMGGAMIQQGALALVQVSLHGSAGRVAPAPPPATWGAYQTKGEEHGGVIAMLDLLLADIDKDLQQGAVEEKDAQQEYERFIKDSGSKRAADTASIARKVSAKADLEVEVQRQETEEKSTKAEAMATAQFLAGLHQECDWLLQNFEVRKEARAGEVESLKKAKAVLAGADFSLAQTGAARALRR